MKNDMIYPKEVNDRISLSVFAKLFKNSNFILEKSKILPDRNDPHPLTYNHK